MKFKLFGKGFEIKALAYPAVSDDRGWSNYLSGLGYSVNATTALQISAVFRCVDLISRTIASLPLHLYKETKTGKEKAKDHRLYQLLHSMPNSQTTAYEFWQMYIANLMLTWGAFAKIQRNPQGRITGLWNIPTANVSEIQIDAVNGERYIDVHYSNGSFERLREFNGDFMYTPGFLFSNRNEPENPLHIAAEVLGLTGQITQYAKNSVNGNHPGGFVEFPKGLSGDALERFKKDFHDNYRGVMNAGKWMVLEEGSRANQFDRDLEKMQVIESRQFAVTEICRIWGVPPHKVMDLTHATFSNIEQENIQFVAECLDPFCVRFEQSIYRDLLTENERLLYYAKFTTNALMRGDMATRTTYYHQMRQDGVMNGNEIRELEDMNNMPGDLGDLYLVNGNMITVENAKQNYPKGMTKGASQ